MGTLRRLAVCRCVRFPHRRGEHGHGLLALAARLRVEDPEDLPAGVRYLELLVVELDRAELGVVDTYWRQGSVYGLDVALA